MKIRSNLKLKTFKLNKIIDNSIEAKNQNINCLFNNLTTNNFNSQDEKTFKKSYDINSMENTVGSKKFGNYNKKMNINLIKSLDNKMKIKCFSVPQTLNYYGRNNIKVNAANAIKKMNKLLMKKNINNLSLPKNPLMNIFVKQNQNKNRFNSLNNNINHKKIINIKKNNFLFNDRKKYQIIDFNEKKRNKLSLYEKEK